MSSSNSLPRVSFTKFHNIVDGELKSSEVKHHGVNPANRERLWDVPVATEEDLNDAVKAANKAYRTWSKTPIHERKELVRKFVEVYQSYTEEFTDLLIEECGKPRQTANMEVQATAVWALHHTDLDLPEETLEEPEKTIVTKYVPLGVVGAICPWNFPLMLSVGKIAPSLVTGNCVIVKPSPFTPYSTLKLGEIGRKIFPPGVFQVLGGDDRLGPWMTLHPSIQKISFTGSVATGKRVMEACSKTLKRVTLELGGNDASIVCPDVDIEKVAPELVMGAMQNSGQVCVATKRIYIHKDIYPQMVAAMSKVTQSLKVGQGNTEGVSLGPVQNAMQYKIVKGFLEDSKKNGHKFATGGEVNYTDKGFFITPTIVDQPPEDSRIVQEEPFGPIVPTLSWTDEEDVLARANKSNTGLGACVWSRDPIRARRLAERLEAGSVFVNSFEKPTPAAAFGGHKESGIGAEWGSQGLLAFCNIQVIHYFK